jgi:hypothetical protein
VRRRAAIAALVLCAWPAGARAQAWTLPAGLAAFTLGGQWVDNTGHRLSDGNLVGGTSVTASVFAEVEYAFTDRFAASAGLGYVFARWTDDQPPPFPIQPVDACHCWNSSFQDFTFAARYRFGNDPWAVTPLVRFVVPSHSYETRGEAVVGRNLREAQIGLTAGLRLARLLPDATLQAGFAYAFVEKVLDVPNDRSNAFVEIGYAPLRRLYLHLDGRWQWTHGGLRTGYLSGDPFPPPGEINTPDRVAEHDRLLRDDHFRVEGGVSYSFDAFDVFASYVGYVRGTDTHTGRAITTGLTYYFGR